MVLTTRLASAKKGTKSLKTTVPEGIVEFLEVGDEDHLEWRMEVRDTERVAVVSKQKHESTDGKADVDLAHYSMLRKKR